MYTKFSFVDRCSDIFNFQECASQLSVPNEALTHYRAVCRAMVSEALELSTFMEKVAQCDEERAEELRELDMQDWVSLM